MQLVELPSLTHAAIAAAAAFLCYSIYWELTVGARRRKIIRENGCLAPNKYPDWDPLFGYGGFKEVANALQTQGMLRLSLNRFKKVHLNTYIFKDLGKNEIHTMEPDNLKAVMSSDFKNWTLGIHRKTIFRPLLGVGIFTSDGSDWQHSREMLRPNFHRSQVADISVLEHHAQDLIRHIPRDGSVVNMWELFFSLTMDSATEFLFGTSTGMLSEQATSKSNEGNIQFAKSFNIAQYGVAEDTRYGPFIGQFMSKPYKEHIKYVHKFCDEIVGKALANKEKLGQSEGQRYIFLYELVQRINDPVRIRSELLNVLLAGRESTASLLSNVWHVLVRRPDIFEKVRAEVLDGVGTENAPTWEQLKELKYLRAILNESLRLYPVLPHNSRQASADTYLPRGGGPDGNSPMFVPKGRMVVWSNYAMHRRTDLWGDDAEEFRPERWFEDKCVRPGWKYLPFNGGPRVCLGQQFSLTEASYMCIRLLQQFSKIETTDTQPWTEQIAIGLTHANGLPLKFTCA